MCGIAGLYTSDYSNFELAPTALRMVNAIRHRGPDGCGVWTEPSCGLALAHQRLAILDQSSAGAQPMVSACGRWVLVFNGEIYNVKNLRSLLESLGHTWRGYSDTEVMLTAIAQWGIEITLPKLVGMFASAIWDQKERILYLFRDRLGEKPLYYGWVNNTFVFGSELKAICAYPNFTKEINRNALALLMKYGYIPAPHSIYKNIYKLIPGTCLKLTNLDQHALELQTYWSVLQIAQHGLHNPFYGNEQEAVIELESLLIESIKNQMIADVPLGAFLSGGIDSSTIVALMQKISNQPIKTFSVGFWETSFDEAVYARRIAKHLGTDHTEIYLTSAQALEMIPNLSKIYDEPFADSSQIPTALITALARRQVTVSLSGDGGDEVFCGYNRYILAKTLWQRIQWMPPMLRNSLASAITVLNPNQLDNLFYVLKFILPSKLHYSNFGDKLHKLAPLLSISTSQQLYQQLITFWSESEMLVLHSQLPELIPNEVSSSLSVFDLTQQMMLLDLITYLPGDILVKLDRASMAASLETRAPFLDHRVVEFSWTLPINFHLHQGHSKWLLRQILYRYIPPKLIERPKMGFGIPLGDWLRGPLRDWAETLLDAKKLNQEGWLNSNLVNLKWCEHLNGKRNWSYHLWNVLMFENWLAENSLS